MAYSRSDYQLATRHVIEAEARIARQRELLTHMRRTGQPLELGEDLLDALENSAAQMRRHREAICVDLGRAP